MKTAQKIKVNDINIAYKIYGSGPPLLLINGLGDDMETWAAQLDFAKHFQLIIFDNRGIGHTDAGSLETTTIAQMAEDTYGLLQALQIPKAHILGHSMGGMIAQELAISHPEVIDKLLLCSTIDKPSKINNYLFTQFVETVKVLNYAKLVPTILTWCFSPAFFESHFDSIKEIEKAAELNPVPKTVYISHLTAIQMHDARDRLGEIKAKTCVLGAKGDLLFTVEQEKEIASRITGAVLELTDGGHANCWECPGDFNAAVEKFLLNG